MFRWIVPVLLLPAMAQEAPGDAAYRALRSNELDRAVALFREAVGREPSKAALRKDFAYALLRVGEREEARDQFAEAIKLDPADERIALEYAYLCFETKKPAEARRAFARLKQSADAAIRASAEQAFQNIDRPLREGIARWKQAIAAAPGQWSAHQELARLAEERDDLDLAAEHYREAWRLRPAERKLMLDLARVLAGQGKARESTALLLAASRGAEPRIAESAKEKLPARYPYPYEFEDALALEPGNAALRREYAYLLLAMNKEQEAVAQLRLALEANPADAESRKQLEALRPTSKQLGLRSFEKSYLADALRYLHAAHEEDPSDEEVWLKLAWTYNLLKRDDAAIEWFNRARRSPRPEIASEAGRAYRNLRASNAGLRTTVWTLPFFSSRWSSGLIYGQTRTEMRVGRTPLRPYLSMRFIGDTQGRPNRGPAGVLSPGYLSDTAVIFGAGLGAQLRRFHIWGEAGEAVSYLGREAGRRTQPDYRGGVSWLKAWGARRTGWFVEQGADAVYVSRYQDDIFAYLQTRAGYTIAGESGVIFQPLWHWNVTADSKRLWWGNFVESGPGLRLRWNTLPPGMWFRFEFLRGAHLVNAGNPRRPNYWDYRAGVWYAFAR
jgi:Tfp pilus assembly protein PilF